MPKSPPSILLPPTHRHRSKSAPRVRGKSPDAKGLKKAAAAAVKTPSPKGSKDSSAGSSGVKAKGPKRKLSFGEAVTYDILAENPAGTNKPGGDDMVKEKADQVWAAMKEDC